MGFELKKIHVKIFNPSLYILEWFYNIQVSTNDVTTVIEAKSFLHQTKEYTFQFLP